jgi:phosphatidylglycerophosphatase A
LKPNPRAIVVWENVKGPRAIFATVVATALGAGLIPLAPGTWGTIISMPLAYVSADWDWPARVALWTVIAVVGIWAGTTFDEVMGTADNQCIVIDEVVGLGITAWTAGHDLKTLLAAFVLFRFFDVVKPPPIRQIDLWSKKMASRTAKNGSSGQIGLGRLSRHWGGFGVMADDVLAGFEALAVVALLQWWKILG